MSDASETRPIIRRTRPNLAGLMPTTIGQLNYVSKMAVLASGGSHKNAVEVARAYMIIQHGLTLGLSPAEATANLHITKKGRMAMSAEFQRARAFQSGLVARWEETTDEHGTITLESERADNGVTLVRKLRRQDVEHLIRRAKPGSPWKNYPQRMMWARITTYMCRDLYPDVMSGYITVDEATEIEGEDPISLDPDAEGAPTGAEAQEAELEIPDGNGTEPPEKPSAKADKAPGANGAAKAKPDAAKAPDTPARPAGAAAKPTGQTQPKTGDLL